MEIFKSVAIFIIAGFCEIGGGLIGGSFGKIEWMFKEPAGS